ncbi:hypothetical protein FAM8374_03016 [Lacticaseibacillus paracasei]|nr:hypothetical protein FAM8374_03016 [Lacticaseibacillus paracasei]
MPDYPSNISRAQFALIQPDLENFRKHTRLCTGPIGPNVVCDC